MPLGQSVGRLLAAPVEARLALPCFDQSAMDGYAVAASLVADGETVLPVSQRILAGQCGQPLLQGTAARIFAGAPLPEGADAVVMQEQAVPGDGRVCFHGPVTAGTHVRRRGEDSTEGEVSLTPGTLLSPRHLGLLASQGMADVPVLRRPVVVVLSTGGELRSLGSALGPGAIYDSNRPMVLALAAEAGLEAIDGGCLPDNADLLAQRLSDLSGKADMVVTSAGASVGDEDNSLKAAEAAGFRCEALRVAMKPGKPAVVGQRGKTAYLGLPGNPFSDFLSWTILGRAMVAALAGRSWQLAEGFVLPAANCFGHKQGRTEFAPARLCRHDGRVQVELLGQGVSRHLKPLSAAEGLAEIHSTSGVVKAEDSVRFHPFP